jgi:ElaB/YqjD/DUF883 family membrane-anchored ribosome-binding protein
MITDKFDRETRDFSEDLVALRDDMAKLTTSVAELLRNQASTAASNVGSAIDQARQKVTESAGDAQTRMRSAASDLETTIERNPLTAILVALVAGLMVGLFTRSGK